MNERWISRVSASKAAGSIARLGIVLVLIGALATAGAAAAPSADANGANQWSQSKTIAMIGAGNLGKTLGGLWAAAGYHVIFATRHPDELDTVVADVGHGAEGSAVGPAVRRAGIIVLAVPYSAEPSIARQYGDLMKGKVLVDTDNAFASRDGAIVVDAEQIGEAVYSSRLFEGTRFVRAFNMIGAQRYPPPNALDTANFKVVYTTNDASTRPIAEALIRATGGRPVYEGGLNSAPEDNAHTITNPAQK